MELFSFGKNWDQLKPLLHQPAFLAALDLGMDYECTRASFLPDWDPTRGPWYYSVSEVLFRDPLNPQAEAPAVADLLAWAKQRGCPEDHVERMSWRAGHFADYARRRQRLLGSVLPRPGTLDWFRCYGACMGLAVWCGVLARELMPELEWLICYSTQHTCAVGHRRAGSATGHFLQDAVMADVLWGDLFSPGYTVRHLLDGDLCHSCPLDDYADVLRDETARFRQLRGARASSVSRPATPEDASRRSGHTAA